MQTWEQTYEATAGTSLDIEQRSGLVKVIGWEQPSIKVVATSPGSTPIEERLSVDAEPGALYLRVKRSPGIFFFGGDERVDLELYVPFQTTCRIESGSGGIEVLSTRGDLQAETGSGRVTVAEVNSTRVETGSGSITIRHVDGRLEASTGSGSIEVETVNGDATLETGSGSIAARVINGDLHAETGSGRLAVARVVGGAQLESGSGNVEVQDLYGPSLHVETGGGGARLLAVNVRELEVEASSGRVEAELAGIHPGGMYQIETGSGGVTVAIPQDAGLSVSVEAPSGRIAHQGLNLQVRHAARGELEAQMNDGDAQLTIEAGSGSVELRAYQGRGQAPEPPAARVASVAPVPPAPTAPAVRLAPPAMPAMPAMPAPPAPPSEAEVALLKVIQSDAALESSEQIRRVLAMVETGKLTPEEAAEILRALDEEETPA
jgi:DUF4097 and DUF4098 domain-containing protein YvlB